MANHHTRENPQPTDEQRRELRRRKIAQALALRARIVLAYAEGPATRPWRMRWERLGRRWASGADGFRPEAVTASSTSLAQGAPRSVGGEAVEEVVTRTLESTPRGATHWSTRSMAAASGLSPATVSRIWRVFALQPHRDETFKLSKDPLFIEKARDIVGLHLSPPERAGKTHP